MLIPTLGGGRRRRFDGGGVLALRTTPAGLTRPPEVGTCVMEMRRVGPLGSAGSPPSASMRSSAATSTCPAASLGITSITTPLRAAACGYGRQDVARHVM